MKQIGFNKQSQSGMALIAVLLFLILITIAGAIAVRQSSVDLKLATADQAGTLLLNSSDSAIAYIEQSSTPGHPNYTSMMSQSRGILGYFLTDSNDKIDDQVKFCYRSEGGNLGLLDLRSATLLLADGGTRNAAGGICNPDKLSDYTSARGTAINQIIVRGVVGQDTDSDDFKMVQEGEDNVITGITVAPRIQIHSVSILPALASADAKSIKGCLAHGATKPEDYTSQSITGCMKSIGVPTTSLVEEATIVKDVRAGDKACETDPALCQSLGLSDRRP